MPYTSPATVVTATTITSAWGNSVKAATDFLANPPACRVYHSTTQSIPDNTLTNVAFNAESYDTDTMHDTVTNNSRITFKTAGLFLLEWHIQCASGGDYVVLYHDLLKNGATTIYTVRLHPSTTADLHDLIATTVKKFAVNDYVQLRVLQDNTANAARNLSAMTTDLLGFSATWIGLG